LDREFGELGDEENLQTDFTLRCSGSDLDRQLSSATSSTTNPAPSPTRSTIPRVQQRRRPKGRVLSLRASREGPPRKEAVMGSPS
jgi:hypothetical protein